MPIDAAAALGDEDAAELGSEALRRAAELPELERTSAGYVWTGRDYPAARVSLRSGEAVARGLEEAGHEALRVTISREGAWDHEGATVELVPGEGLLSADAVFPALHGPFGEDGSVQGLLRLLGVPFVGSDVLGSAVAMDKLMMKAVFAAHGLAQTPYAVVSHHEWTQRPEATAARLRPLGLPVFVKPANLGSSVGISKAKSRAALRPALDLAGAFDRSPVPDGGARVTVLQGSVALPPVNVTATGEDAAWATQLGYGRTSEAAVVPAGTYDVEVNLADSGDTAISTPGLVLEGNSSYVLVIMGEPNNTDHPLEIRPLVDTTEERSATPTP